MIHIEKKATVCNSGNIENGQRKEHETWVLLEDAVNNKLWTLLLTRPKNNPIYTKAGEPSFPHKPSQAMHEVKT